MKDKETKEPSSRIALCKAIDTQIDKMSALYGLDAIEVLGCLDFVGKKVYATFEYRLQEYSMLRNMKNTSGIKSN